MASSSKVLAALDGLEDYSSNINSDPAPASVLNLNFPVGRVPYSVESSASQSLKRDISVLFNPLIDTPLKKFRADLEDDDDDDDEHREQMRFSSAAVGFSLNYDREGRVTNLDRRGEALNEEILEEFVSESFFKSGELPTVAQAMKIIGLKNLDDVLPGMEFRLMKHQVQGVAWMKLQEQNQYKGGIMADEMGLGKTVQMITTMSLNPPKNRKVKTTLIVVPLALLQQWKEEIETKTNDLFTVHLHHGRTKLKKAEDIAKYDVIITTYGALNTNFEVPSDIETDEEDEYLAKNGGLLSKIHWYRVILDEAQVIRNRSTLSSMSVARLKADYRWMLTGTPITNTLADIYGLIRFGQFRPWNLWSDFNEFICKVQLSDPPLAGERARVILKPIIIRRTKKDKIDGEPLLNLPPKDIEIVHLEFSKEEREIYDSFEKKAQIELNKYIRAGTIMKETSAVLVMILRLRQLSCHPHLILSEGIDDPSQIIGDANSREAGRATKLMGKDWVHSVKARFVAKARLEDFQDGEDETDVTCPVCHEFYMNGTGRILSCKHQICIECLDNLLHSPMPHSDEFQQGTDAELANADKEYEKAVQSGARPCPTCHKNFDPQKIFASSAFEPDLEALRSEKSRAKKLAAKKEAAKKEVKKRARTIMDMELSSDDDLPDGDEILGRRPMASIQNKGRDAIDVKGKKTSKYEDDSEGGSDSEDIGKVPQPSEKVMGKWRRHQIDVEPSAKMVAMVNYLKEWDAQSGNEDKTIIYSQWTSMLDLVESLFLKEGIDYLRYDGSMNNVEREFALSQFKKMDTARVILISIKAGSVGLNLCVANRVINLDLSWNYASESQAYDRVHRVGQGKQVYIKRLVVKDTIEERMLRLQSVKMDLSDAALNEGTNGMRLTKMSVKELKTLFGMIKEKPPQPPAEQAQSAVQLPGVPVPLPTQLAQ